MVACSRYSRWRPGRGAHGLAFRILALLALPGAPLLLYILVPRAFGNHGRIRVVVRVLSGGEIILTNQICGGRATQAAYW
jgi:hypothetical protein